MTDARRCNVAFTRTRGVLWILGGTMDWILDPPSRWWAREHAYVHDPPFVKYKEYMAQKGLVHRMSV